MTHFGFFMARRSSMPDYTHARGNETPSVARAQGNFQLTGHGPAAIQRPPDAFGRSWGDVLQGAAADCNSAGETHAWFDSRVAHHSPQNQ
jgi:hypothetical protein